MFYQMGGTWRIMNDPKMRSARKRRSDGMETFEDHTDTTTQRAQNIQSGRPEGVCVCVWLVIPKNLGNWRNPRA